MCVIFIVLIIVLIIYCICYNTIENNSYYGFNNRIIKLHTDLDLKNITITDIKIIKTSVQSLKTFTETLSHHDLLLKDNNNNCYLYYIYSTNSTYDNYIIKIDNSILNNSFYLFEHDNNQKWIYYLPKKWYTIKPTNLNVINYIYIKLILFGYHLLKYNCKHRIEILINILKGNKQFKLDYLDISSTTMKIIFEYFQSLLK